MTELSDRLRSLADQQHEGSELEVTLRHAADKLDLLDRLREVSECPPDCGLEDWIKILVNCWHDECQERERRTIPEVNELANKGE